MILRLKYYVIILIVLLSCEGPFFEIPPEFFLNGGFAAWLAGSQVSVFSLKGLEVGVV